MPILYWSEVNTEDKIKAFFYMNDVLFDPVLVKYTIYQPNMPIKDKYDPRAPIPYVPISSQTEKDALRYDVGHFYADWTVGNGAAIGLYRIIWIFRVNSGEELRSKASMFNIVRDLNEECEARHFPPDGDGGDGNGGKEQCGTCSCPSNTIIRDQFGRIIYP